MAKQLNVNLAFTADTSKAKAQLQDLQNQLNNIVTSKNIDFNLEKDLRGAVKAAAELSTHLSKATNINTGNLDFAKFNRSIKQSGASLGEYAQKLQSLGPQGQQAFLSLAQSVATAEIPIRRSNALLTSLGTSLANTARWQLSSSMLHGFMGAVQSAYGYAQDLNESLNNIRIVTGQNIDQMSRFAEEANKAARALSTTTTEYTNASLIYYQQGLNDQQVKERTDITIKMANVSRQSAEMVSDQMTAVWNNFAKGSENLEHFADVMTALGAATASSTSEISEGLNKFAAVAETVGLSYEYAASALATVTATTRQSADVVGTAFKTLFARIQDLELGKTLDDGTTLGKYSEALSKVGVNIKDTSGQMKQMDTILEEMATKWDTLGQAEKTALAQSVAGVRQYTQLIALMDNWDFMQKNLSTAKNSSGALQAQADTYAESWEAAQKRVKSAAENVYTSLIKDEFFIDLLNNIEKVIKFVDNLIDNVGGLEGIFVTLGMVVTKVFSSQISQGLTNMIYNIKMMTKAGREAEEQARKKFIDDAINHIPQSKEYTTNTEKAQQDSMRTQLTLQQEYMENANRMSSIEAETNKKLMDRARILREEVVSSAQQVDRVSKEISNIVDDINTDVASFNMSSSDPKTKIDPTAVQQYTASIKKSEEYLDILASKGKQAFEALSTEPEKAQSKMQDLAQSLNNVEINVKELGVEGARAFNNLKTNINQVISAKTPEELENALRELNRELEILSKHSGLELKNLVGPDVGKKVDELTSKLREKTKAQRESADGARAAAAAEQEAAEAIANSKGKQMGWTDMLVQSANVAFSAASAFNMLGGMINKLKDPDATGWEKFLTVMTTLGMVIPTLVSAWGTLKTLLSQETLVKIANTAATWAQVAAEKALKEERGENTEGTKKNIKNTVRNTKEKIRNTWNQASWDKMGDTQKQQYTEQALKNKGYYKGKHGDWMLKGGSKTDKLSNDAATQLVGKDATKLAGKAAGQALGKVALKAGAAAAAIAIVVGTVKWAEAQANKAEKALEKAEGAAKTAAQNLETVRNSYNNFMSAASNYDSAVESLKELTKGTAEYKEAVLKANEEASKLLDTNENLKYTIQDGQIKIDENSLEQAKLEEAQRLENAQIANISAQNQVRTAEENLKKRDMSRELWTSKDAGLTAANIGAATAAGAGAGALLGTVIPGIGNAVGAGIGALVGLAAGAITGVVATVSTGIGREAENEALEKLEEAYLEDDTILQKLKDGSISEADWDKIGIDDTSLREALKENGKEVSELVKEMGANTKAIEAQNDVIASTALSDNENVQTSKYKDQIVDVAGDIYGQTYDKLMESADWLETWGKDGISKANGANKEAKKVFDEYLKYAGLEGQGYKLTDTTGTDGNRKFIYKDKEGNEQEVTLEAMQAARAAYEASQTLDKTANKLAETFEKLAKSANAADKGLLSLLAYKDLGQANRAEFDDLYKEMADSQGQMGGSISKADVEAYLDKKLGDGKDGQISNETAQAQGYDNAEEMITAIYNKMNDAKEAWESIETPEGLKGLENIDLDLAQQIEKTYDVIGKRSSDNEKIFTEGINNILSLKELTEEEQQSIMSELMSIDWTNWNAINDVDNKLKNFGINIDVTDEQWITFANNMRLATASVKDLAEENKKLFSVLKSLEDLEFGKEVSKEDYEEIIINSPAMEKYFLQSDNEGNRTFIGNKNILEKTITDSYINNYKNMVDRVNLLKDVENVRTEAEIESYYAGGSGGDGGFNFNTNNTARDILGNIYSENYDSWDIMAQDSNGRVNIGMSKDVHEVYDFNTGNKITQGTYGSVSMNKSDADRTVMDYARGQELQRLIDDGLVTDDFLSSFSKDYSVDYIQDLIDKANTGATADLTKDGNNLIQNVLDDIRKQLGTDYTDQIKTDKEIIANRVDDINTLNQLKIDGYLGDETDNTYEKAVNRISGSQMQEAQSLTDLNSVWNQSSQDVLAGVELDYGIYAENLKRLAESYTICTDEINKYNLALQSEDQTAIESAQEALEASILLGEASDKYGLSQEELSVHSKQLMEASKDINGEYQLNARQAAKLAIENQRMNQGVEELVNNWEDWKKELKNTDKTSRDWVKAATDCTKTIAKLVGASEDLELPADFFDDEKFELLDQAVEGNIDAISKLGIAVATSQIEILNWQKGMSILGEDSEGNIIPYDETSFNTAKDNVINGLNDIYNNIENLNNSSLNIDEVINPTEWASSLNELAKATQMSVEEMNAILSEAGVDAEVVTDYADQETTVPQYTTYTSEPEDATSDGYEGYTKQTSFTKVTGYTTVTGKVPVAQINMGEDGKSPDIKYIGNGSVSQSAQSGGNKGSTSKGKDSRKKKTDVVDRYKEVNDSLEKTNRLMQKNSTLAEGMWGKGKINMMKQNVNLMKQENELLEDKLDLANEYLAEDRAELEATGIGFAFDESGTITNYTTQMESLFAEYDAQLEAYGGDDADLTEDQKEVLDNMWEHIEIVKAAYEKYETTLDEVQDLEQEQLEKQLEIQQQNFDILNETLEANLAFEENQLDYIEHKLNMISGNFYQMAEGIALMIGSLDENGNIDISGSQFDMYQSNYSTYKNQKDDLDKSYATYLASGGKDGINQDQYIQGLEDLSSRVMENVENMKALDDAMFTYYGETLAAASEKLSRFTALQEHNISVLDHMQTTMELLGKASDPKNLSSIINAQAEVALDNLETSEEWYDKMKAQADARKKEYDDKYAELMKDGNMSQEDWEVLAWYEEQWLSAQEVANEAEDKMYSDFETWLQKTKDATKNAVDVANKEWEKSLITSMFGEQNPFKSFDDLTLALDRQKSLQEDILTTTNKKYETDKLIRQVQQDIDKSTNSVAKKELKAFIERTKEKQNQNKLSETELGILQQEYELLQAKIALEEAQNAKSTVRLQRDSEGNFGYVYTADQDKVADAEQAYADAENTLYNARLDAANEYSEKYIQTMAEMHATLSELEEQYYNGEFASLEEYQNAVTAATDYYYAQLEQYQDIYHNIFKDNASWTNDFVSGESGDLRETVTDDVTLMKESMIGQMGLANTNWCSNFDTIDTRTSTWKTKTDGYTDDVEGYFSDMEKTIGEKITTSGNHFSAYQSLVNTETGEIDGDLTSIQTETQNIISKNEALTKSLTDPKTGLIKGLDDEVNAVARVVTAYGPFKQAIQDAIDKQSELLELLNQELSLQYTENAPENEDTSNSDNSNNNDNNNNDSNDNSNSNNQIATGESVTVKTSARTFTRDGGNGTWMQSWVPGSTFKALRVEGDEVLIGYGEYSGGYTGWVRKTDLEGFDTGGYTGSWNGGYGKMALLHEKELVLNAGDTENFLASMEFLDSIVKTIDLYSANAQWGGMLSTPTFGSYGSEPLEQNIHIEASFPNATDRFEIEEAFKSMADLASQYANRK